MRVLVACEYSGAVRDAFLARGHDAMSCDLLPTESPGPHHHGSVLDILDDGWDLMIAHPPCTHLAVSGARWFPDKRVEQEEALAFVRTLLDAPIPRIALENPVSIISTRIRKPNQYISWSPPTLSKGARPESISCRRQRIGGSSGLPRYRELPPRWQTSGEGPRHDRRRYPTGDRTGFRLLRRHLRTLGSVARSDFHQARPPQNPKIRRGLSRLVASWYIYRHSTPPMQKGGKWYEPLR